MLEAGAGLDIGTTGELKQGRAFSIGKTGRGLKARSKMWGLRRAGSSVVLMHIFGGAVRLLLFAGPGSNESRQ